MILVIRQSKYSENPMTNTVVGKIVIDSERVLCTAVAISNSKIFKI